MSVYTKNRYARGNTQLSKIHLLRELDHNEHTQRGHCGIVIRPEWSQHSNPDKLLNFGDKSINDLRCKECFQALEKLRKPA